LRETGFGAGYSARFLIRDAQIVLHKADQPNLLADSFDASALAGKHYA
jgi:hypothetical protein